MLSKYFKISPGYYIQILTVLFLTTSCSIKNPVIKLSPKKAEISVGDSVKISWSVRNVRKGTKIYIPEVIDNLPRSGNISVKPYYSTRYAFIVEPFLGKKIKKRIIITVKPYIEYFQAYRLSEDNNKVSIHWSAVNAKYVNIEGVGKNLPGTGNKVIELDSAINELVLKAWNNSRTIVTSECKIRESIIERPFITGSIDLEDLQNEEIFFEIISIDKSNYPNEVKLKVIAYDVNGNFVHHLADSNIDGENKRYFIKLIEKVEKQSYEADFTVTEVNNDVSAPNDISLVLDYSGSMFATIDFMEEAVKQLLENKYIADRICITKFDDKLVNETPLLSDKNKLARKADFGSFKKFGGATALYAAADLGIETIEKSNNNRKLILFTDGRENSSMLYLGERAFTAEMLAEKVQENDIDLIIITYGLGVNHELLAYLAMLTGGKIYFLFSPSSFNYVLKEIPHNYRHYYEICYKPASNEIENDIELICYDNKGYFKTIKRRLYFSKEVLLDSAVLGKGIYINNKDSISKFLKTINRKIDLNKKVNIDSLEIEKETYWYDSTVIVNNMQPIGPPQSLVFFKFDETEIDTIYYSNLNKIASYFKTQNNYIIKIIGHTDSKGNEEYCYQLSEDRAIAVKNYFVSKGINENRIITAGLGKDQLIWKEDNIEWRAKENRRVELIIYKINN